jgi:hypothetical protein
MGRIQPRDLTANAGKEHRTRTQNGDVPDYQPLTKLQHLCASRLDFEQSCYLFAALPRSLPKSPKAMPP